MNQAQIERLNILAKKSKTEGLTDAEKQEQAELRRAYIAAFRGSLEASLKNAYILDENGNEQPLKKKER